MMKSAFTSFFDTHLREVLKGASSALMIRLFGTVVGFAVSVLISRLLGTEGTGIYFLALTVATIAATIGRVGFDNTIVRFIASHAAIRDWVGVRFVYLSSVRVIAPVSMLVSIGLFLGAEWFAVTIFDKPFMAQPFRLVSAAVLPLALAILHAESLRGLKLIPSSQWIKTVSISLGTLLLLYPLTQAWGANGAVIAYAGSVLITSLIAWLLWHKAWRSTEKLNSIPHDHLSLRSLFQSSWPLFGVALTGLVMQQAATIFLGIWGTTNDVGIFNVANRIASLLLFPLMAMISILAPKFAAMYRQGDMDGLKRLARSSSWLLTLISLPVAVLVAAGAEWILAIFGSDFKDGAMVLTILLVGVVVNAATGPVANLLMMSGHEYVVRNTAVFASLLILVMCLLLIPRYGMIGAATATSLGIAVQNLTMTYMVRRYLGFSPVFIDRGSRS